MRLEEVIYLYLGKIFFVVYFFELKLCLKEINLRINFEVELINLDRDNKKLFRNWKYYLRVFMYISLECVKLVFLEVI